VIFIVKTAIFLILLKFREQGRAESKQQIHRH